MPKQMNCPGCQTPLRLRDDLAGKKIKCPRCSKVILVPEVEVTVLEEVPDDSITDEPPARKKGKKSARLEIEREDGSEVGRSKYKPCPRCGEEGAKRVKWTPWGSFYGPALLTHVRCPGCGYAYNGKTGGSNLIFAIIFVTIPMLVILGILGALAWFVHHQGYF
jgi:DNA-directed RNA polymerase subunit RPC12/RpoP